MTLKLEIPLQIYTTNNQFMYFNLLHRFYKIEIIYNVTCMWNINWYFNNVKWNQYNQNKEYQSLKYLRINI